MGRLRVPLEKPKPDIETFCAVVRRERIPSRPPLVELMVDEELMSYFLGKHLKRKWVGIEDRETRETYLRNNIEFWYRFGYDYIRLSGGLNFPGRSRVTEDTASLSSGKRGWAEEGRGPISSWEEFEKYPWPDVEKVDLEPYEFVSRNLPEGMGLFACPSAGILEVPLNSLMGYETLSFALYDKPDLVKAVFDRVGELIYGFYKRIVGLSSLYGFFQGDDMGFKTATLFSPQTLREYVLPWHKKIASLAHENGLLYLFHACGNLEAIMEDLIEDVRIDAKHSFEDAIMPVAEFRKKYGDRIAVLGGVDVDVLARSSQENVRKRTREILDECMSSPGYALGSGNSVANYVPAENYVAMVEEGLNWG